MKTEILSTYRGVKLRKHEQNLLSYWLNEKKRKELMAYALEGVSKQHFDKTFMGILEKDRIESTKNGKKWPDDYI